MLAPVSKQDFKIEMYRLLDASFGMLDTSMRIQFELEQIRHTQVRIRQASLQGPLLIALTAAAVGVPAVWGILPDDSPRRLIIGGVIVIIALIAGLAVKQICDGRSEMKALENLTSPYSDQSLYQRADYLLFRISSYGSRLAAAERVRSLSTDAAVQRRFELAAQHWKKVLLEVEDEINVLQRGNRLTAEEAGIAKQWLESALTP